MRIGSFFSTWTSSTSNNSIFRYIWYESPKMDVNLPGIRKMMKLGKGVYSPIANSDQKFYYPSPPPFFNCQAVNLLSVFWPDWVQKPSFRCAKLMSSCQVIPITEQKEVSHTIHLKFIGWTCNLFINLASKTRAESLNSIVNNGANIVSCWT